MSNYDKKSLAVIGVLALASLGIALTVANNAARKGPAFTAPAPDDFQAAMELITDAKESLDKAALQEGWFRVSTVHPLNKTEAVVSVDREGQRLPLALKKCKMLEKDCFPAALASNHAIRTLKETETRINAGKQQGQRITLVLLPALQK